MESLARIFLACVELFEAEGRVLRWEIFRLVTIAAILCGALLIGMGGAAFLVYGIYWALSAIMPHAAAAIIVGVVMMSGATGAIVWAIRWLKS